MRTAIQVAVAVLGIFILALVVIVGMAATFTWMATWAN